MTRSTNPHTWQDALAARLTQALTLSRLAHAPLSDGAGEATGTRWRLPARAVQIGNVPAAALAEMLGAGKPAAHGELAKRCLQQFRQMDAHLTQDDDLGRALAAYLGACRQAFDQQPLSAERWQAITQWLRAWVIDELPWEDVPLAERQDVFERFATLAVALGEWTVQASRQGGANPASATWMARNSLKAQLGLDLPALCAVLRGLDGSIAANPSVNGAELGAAADRQRGADPV
ncbi:MULTISPECIES: DUF6683 family protein [unclassified Roseateles]|uniref:DUF6683 family protein n=1 Tax=unclassified Roseateles TaxID=2626991 RepID=UPI00070032C7|nr:MULTISPECIES: DUF6683 family protein [unclassified Roseateles]KQW49661.1 hypothetical protein ASC81_25550 [Pelomonas sp. Root405]KRA76120.1 hypothetical protein ASD88_25500 [Pelomonas sp. Root662]